MYPILSSTGNPTRAKKLINLISRRLALRERANCHIVGHYDTRGYVCMFPMLDWVDGEKGSDISQKDKKNPTCLRHISLPSPMWIYGKMSDGMAYTQKDYLWRRSGFRIVWELTKQNKKLCPVP